jgi:geranylgeranyl pyrophosphate synthase
MKALSICNEPSEPFVQLKTTGRVGKTMRVMEPVARQEPKVDVGQLLAPVRGGLQQVEAKMKGVDGSVFAPLAHAFLDLIGSGGKRLRPALALLAARLDPAANAPDESVIALAAAVEMLHTSSLVHDDVIDGALLRRGAPTLNAVWNGGATVLAGNYMFGTAAAFAAETQHSPVIRLFANTLRIIVDGELRQLAARNEYHQEKSSYYERIYAKTASLFCAATEGAALLAAVPERQVRQLREYGYGFGMAFQIVDDILDFTGDESSLGKPAGSDLRQGTLTLPFFYYLQQHPQPALLIDRFQQAQETLEEGEPAAWHTLVDQTVAEVRSSTAIAAAQREASTFLDQARTNLAELPDSVYKQSLLGLCDFVVQRTY